MTLNSPLNRWKLWDPGQWVSCDGCVDPLPSFPGKHAVFISLEKQGWWSEISRGPESMSTGGSAFIPRQDLDPSSQFTESSVLESERKSGLHSP